MSQWRVIDIVESGRAPVMERVANRTAALARAAALKAARGAQPGRTSVHICPHSAGEPASEWYDCKADPRAQYEEV